MAGTVIDIEHVTFGYDGEPALRDVDLHVHQGEFVSLVGPNGGGKSTLLKLVLGLLQPDRGTVRVFGLPPRKARPRIGYMPQHAHHDPRFPATVIEVVLMGRLDRFSPLGPFRAKDRQQALHALEQVGLADIARKPFSDLSGGQRQRVLVARAIAPRPHLLLLDEPTSHIDVGAANEFHNLMERLNRDQTILIVSHDIGFVSSHVERVVCVNRDVQVHPTSELTGAVLRDIYGSDIRLVRHDHRCSEKEPA